MVHSRNFIICLNYHFGYSICLNSRNTSEILAHVYMYYTMTIRVTDNYFQEENKYSFIYTYIQVI